MNTKKWLSLFLTAVMSVMLIFSAAACADNNSGTNNTSGGGTNTNGTSTDTTTPDASAPDATATP